MLTKSDVRPASTDDSFNQVFDGATHEFYQDVNVRNSIDDRSTQLEGYIHRGVNYNNAFPGCQVMVFGDEDERIPNIR
jgi:Zn-dependent metalloprotease